MIRSIRPRRVAFLAAALFAMLLSVVVPAYASGNDQVTWSVRPSDENGATGQSWVELEVEPGKSAKQYLELQNFGKEPVTFNVYGADGYFTDKGRFNMLNASDTSVEAGTWIEIENEITVPGKDKKIVPFTVTVPEQVTPGDHAAGIAASVSNKAAAGAAGGTVGVDSRVGVRVLIRVPGDINPQLQITDISPQYSQSWNPFSPGTLSLEYTVENTGNARLGFSEAIDGSEAGEPRGELLPGKSRTVQIDLGAKWPLLTKTISLKVIPAFAGSGQDIAPEPITEDARVWTIPFPQLVLFLMVLLLLVGLRQVSKSRKAAVERRIEEARNAGRAEATKAQE